MNLLVLTIDYKPSPGGIGEYGFRLVSELDARGHDVTVLTIRMEGDRAFDERQGYRTVRAPAARWAREACFALLIPYLRASRRIDAVLCLHWYPCATLMRVLGPVLRVPYFVAAYGAELIDASRSLRRRAPWLKRASFAGARRVFPISRYTAGLVAGPPINVPAGRIVLVPGGVSPSEFAPVPGEKALRDGPPLALRRPGEARGALSAREIERRWHEVLSRRKVVLTVARIVDHKGIDVLLAALPGIRVVCPEACTVIAGDGPHREQMERLAADLGLDGHAWFLDYVPDRDLARLYNLADLFVLASRTRMDPPAIEGFGLVFLEAGACGKPVVGGRSGGIPDAVLEGTTGLLADPLSPDDVGRAACRILTDRDLACRMGRQARNRALSSHSWGRVAERLASSMRRGAGRPEASLDAQAGRTL